MYRKFNSFIESLIGRSIILLFWAPASIAQAGSQNIKLYNLPMSKLADVIYTGDYRKAKDIHYFIAHLEMKYGQEIFQKGELNTWISAQDIVDYQSGIGEVLQRGKGSSPSCNC